MVAGDHLSVPIVVHNNLDESTVVSVEIYIDLQLMDEQIVEVNGTS
jgi:hypothetical protein